MQNHTTGCFPAIVFIVATQIGFNDRVAVLQNPLESRLKQCLRLENPMSEYFFLNISTSSNIKNVLPKT